MMTRAGRPGRALPIAEAAGPLKTARASYRRRERNFNVADLFRKVQERMARGHAQGRLPDPAIINASVKTMPP